MYAKYGLREDSHIAALHRDWEGGGFIMVFHLGEMPACASRAFRTLFAAKEYAREHLGIVHWRGFDGRFVASPE